MAEDIWRFKILCIGPAAVGKTSLLHRFVQGKFSERYEYTMGVDYLSKELEFSPKNHATLTIFDLSGQERYKFLRNTFYKGASGALVVFDLTRADTFEKVKEWVAELKILAGDVPFVLIGNKSDLLKDVGNVIDKDAVGKFVEENTSIYIETSAKTGDNVEEIFMELTRRMAFRTDKIKFVEERKEEILPSNPVESQGLLIKKFYEKFDKEALPIIRDVLSKEGKSIGQKIKKKLSNNKLSTVIEAFVSTYDPKIVKIISKSDTEFHVQGTKCPFGIENTSRDLCEAVMSIDLEYFRTAVNDKIELEIIKTLAAGDSCCETIYRLRKK